VLLLAVLQGCCRLLQHLAQPQAGAHDASVVQARLSLRCMHTLLETLPVIQFKASQAAWWLAKQKCCVHMLMHWSAKLPFNKHQAVLALPCLSSNTEASWWQLLRSIHLPNARASRP
jgi:hypothetical protein